MTVKLLLCKVCHVNTVRSKGPNARNRRTCLACYRHGQANRPMLCKYCGATSASAFDAKSRSVCVGCRLERVRVKMAALRGTLKAAIDSQPQCALEPRGCEMHHHSVDATGLCGFCRLELAGTRLSDVLRRREAA